jgi:hypothetical protein
MSKRITRVRDSSVWLLLLLTGVLGRSAWADDVCSAQERQSGEATLARAQAAEASGDLARALELASEPDARGCTRGTTVEEMIKRVAARLGRDAEASGELVKAFDYFEVGAHHADAKRVALAQVRAAPTDRLLAERTLAFMKGHAFEDGVAEIQSHSSRQAAALLAQEEQSFAIRSPKVDLLEAARDWLRIAGDEEAGVVRQRAAARGDQYAALDYPYALQQALTYYGIAARPDGERQVRAKARRLATERSGGDRWEEAASLYEIAGDPAQASALRVAREAQAKERESARKATFEKEQDDLEKELGF